jgi:hypothetical protein
VFKLPSVPQKKMNLVIFAPLKIQQALVSRQAQNVTDGAEP